jgi:hypothetical protein
MSVLVIVESERGEVKGEVPPHARHSAPIDAMLHLTIRTTVRPSPPGSITITEERLLR